MRKLAFSTASSLAACLLAIGADWATQSGSPQREGWVKGEKALTKDKVRDLALLYQTKLNNQSKGLNALTSPLIIGNLITYRGFKEMVLVAGSSDNIFSIDADLNRLLWEKHFESHDEKPGTAASTVTCPGGLTGSIAMPGSSTAVGRFGGGAAARPPARAGAPPAPPPAPRPAAPPGPSATVFSQGFGRNGSVFAVSSDGYLRVVRQSDGHDVTIPPMKFLPPNAKVSSLNIGGTTVFAATLDECGGSPNALYALDLASADKKVVSFPTNGSGPSGAGGTAIGNDGTVYAQVASGHGDVEGDYNDTVLKLSPDELKVQDYFTPSSPLHAVKKGTATPGATPAIFQWKGKDVIVAGGRDGSVYLLDSTSLGGADHHTPLFHTVPVASPDTKYAGNGIWGDFSTWEDPDANTRWVYAALWGPANSDARFPVTNGAAPNGSIVAFKVEEQNGRPVLATQWASRDIVSPASPVTANGLVFALSTGESPRLAKENGSPYGLEERLKLATHATMYVLDGSTGKELLSTRNTVKSFSHGSGLAIANGRVYFTTYDNVLYCYGFPAEQPQLTDH